MMDRSMVLDGSKNDIAFVTYVEIPMVPPGGKIEIVANTMRLSGNVVTRSWNNIWYHGYSRTDVFEHIADLMSRFQAITSRCKERLLNIYVINNRTLYDIIDETTTYNMNVCKCSVGKIKMLLHLLDALLITYTDDKVAMCSLTNNRFIATKILNDLQHCLDMHDSTPQTSSSCS